MVSTSTTERPYAKRGHSWKRAVIQAVCAVMLWTYGPRRAGADEEGTSPEASLSAKRLDALSLEELLNLPVATATKESQSLDLAPAVMVVLTRDDLQSWGYASLEEALKHVLGFYVVDDQVMPNLMVRGLGGGLFGESASVKLLINGVSVAFRPTQGNSLGLDLIPLVAVERVEIIRGPASALYGADAFFGVINVITRSQFDASSGAVSLRAIRNAGASRFGSEISGIVGRDDGPVHYALTASHSTEDRSGLQLPGTSPAPFVASSRSERSNRSVQLDHASDVVHGQAQWQVSQKLQLAVSGYFSRMARDAEFGNLVQLPNGMSKQGYQTLNRIARQQGFANLTADWHLTDAVALSLSGTYFTGTPQGQERVESGSNAVYYKRLYGSHGLDATAELRWHRGDLSVTGGLAFTDDFEEPPVYEILSKFQIGSVAPGGVIRPADEVGTKQFRNVGVYTQTQWKVVPRYLTLTAGLRYDAHIIYGGQPSGRLGVVSQPLDRLTLKLLYGTAFKSPSPFLLYAQPVAPGDIQGNAELRPERVHTAEFEVSYKLTSDIAINTDVAYGLLFGAEFTQSGAYKVAENLARIQSYSWESSIRWRVAQEIDSYLSAELNHTVRDADSEGYESELVGTSGTVYPSIQIHGGVVKTLPRWHLRGSVEYSLVGPRHASVDNTLEKGAAYDLPAYQQVDLGLSVIDINLIKDHPAEVSLTVRNLLGNTTPDPGFAGVDYPRLGRVGFLTFRQEL